MKGTCKSLIQDLRFNGQCVCVWGGGGGEKELPAGGIHASQGTFSSFKSLFVLNFFFVSSLDMCCFQNEMNLSLSLFFIENNRETELKVL